MTGNVLPFRERRPITAAQILVIRARAAQAGWSTCSVYGDMDRQWVLLGRFDDIAYPSNLGQRDRSGIIDYWHLWRERTGWCIKPVSVTFGSTIRRFQSLLEALEAMWSEQPPPTQAHQ